MTGSTYGQPLPPEMRPLAASGHERDGAPIAGKYQVHPELAAAGLWTTPTDLAKFAIEHQLSLAGRSNKILSREMEMKMVTPYIGLDYGMGFQIQNYRGNVYFSHGGGNFGYRCYLIASRDKGYGAVVMTNGAGDRLFSEILRSIAKEYSWDGYLSEPYELVAVSVDRLQRFTGRYLIDVDQTATVTVEGDHLKADVTGEPSIELYPIADDEFIRRDRDSKVRFVGGADPKAGKLQITERGFTKSFAKMSDDQRIPYEDLNAGNIEAALARYREIRAGDPASATTAEDRINNIGYELMGKGKVKEAIATFALNVEFYPSSANAYDSLGEAYMNDGRRELAIQYYEKSLELNPGNANAVEMLKKLHQ
jgi:tetratricopeptide (TPR) repeat protein